MVEFRSTTASFSPVIIKLDATCTPAVSSMTETRLDLCRTYRLGLDLS
jgi:hypothetical protein